MSKIRDIREKNKLTQTYIAEKLGVSQAVVAMWEKGAAMPRADKLPKLAKILKCKIEDLFSN